MKTIYLDYASLTPIDKRVRREIRKYEGDEYTNPSSIYTSGIKTKRAIDDAKERIARIINAHSDEILFTSGGVEANELIINHKINNNKKILISSIEHSSIIHNYSNNKNIIKIPVNKEGIVDLEFLKNSITEDTSLVSIMLVNNEIGSIQPINDIAKIVRDFRKRNNSNFPILHTDACQATNYIQINVEKIGADIISFDGNKIYGPRGIGMLYIKRGSIEINRGGTLNVPGIIGFALALEISNKIIEKENKRLKILKDYFIKELLKINSNIKINGNIENSSVHILNISIPNIDNEFFVLQLDANGIECSTKSACLRDEDESYVLNAIEADSKNSIRFSFGRNTTLSQLKKVIKVIKGILII